jgi:CHAT domain-containing protein
MQRRTTLTSLFAIIMFDLVMAHAFHTHSQSATDGERIDSSKDLVTALINAVNNPDRVNYLLENNFPFISPNLWQSLMDAAAQAYHNRQPDQGIETYRVASEVALRLHDQNLIGKTFHNLGRSYSGLNQFDKAKEAFLSSRKAFSAADSVHDLLYVFSDLGTVSLITQDYEAARNYSEECIKLWRALGSPDSTTNELDTYGAAGAFSTLGELGTREGNLWDAFNNLQRSLELFNGLERRHPTYGYYVADVCASIGRLYTSTGDHVRGLAFLNRALALSTTLNHSNQEAALLNDIGYLYVEQEDYSQAWAKFHDSLQRYRAGKNHREESRSLLNLGVVQQRQQRFEEALTLFRTSLELAKATDNFEVQIAAGEGIGAVFAAKRDFQSALQIFNSSLQLALERKERIREAELLWRIAEVRFAMGDFDSSLGHAEAALEIARLMHSPKLTYLALAAIGQTYAAMNRTELAIEKLKQAIATVELMRHKVAGEEIERQLFFQDKVSSYRTLIDLLLKQNNLSEALLFAERAKGRVLLDVFRSVSDPFPSTVERSEVTRLKRNPSDFNEAQSSDQEQLNRTIREDQTFRNSLYALHPDLKVRLGRTAEINASDLARFTVQPDTAYLEYVIGKDGIDLFLLRAGPRETLLKSFRIEVRPETLRQQINTLNSRLAIRHPDFESFGRQLYGRLVQPVQGELAGIKNICIIPDDFLWNLPFQALTTNHNKYLLEEYSLSYAPSLSVLIEMKHKVRSNPKAALAAFGNPKLTKEQRVDEQIGPIPETESEVLSISKLFTSSRNRVLIGEAASEQSFNKLAKSFSTFHFATHGLLDNKQPLYSHLLLTRTSDDGANDGRLEAREILNLNLTADLAVLSACETANGKISPGEGIIGMSWAFFVAGVRSMVASQWRVNSASTTQLMTDFYSGLQRKTHNPNRSRSQALRTASLKLMRNSRYRHPFYWAPFILIGADN